jgi:hypothetical protein
MPDLAGFFFGLGPLDVLKEKILFHTFGLSVG